MDIDRNTLTSLSSFRMCKPEEKPLYGESPKMSVDFVVVRPGKINVGDKVYMYTGDEWIWPYCICWMRLETLYEMTILYASVFWQTGLTLRNVIENGKIYNIFVLY